MLTSQLAKESGAVDPKALVSADEVKGKKPQEEAECSTVPKQMVVDGR